MNTNYGYQWPDVKPDLPEDWSGWLAPGTAETLTAAYAHKPKVIVECGTWLGLSARAHLQGCPDAKVICIDTWQGSPEHLANPEWKAKLATLLSQCMANLWPWRDRVTLVTADSFVGLVILAVYYSDPDLIYLDSEHTPQRIFGELAICRKFWPRARIVLDDCNNPAVGDTVEVFCRFCQERLIKTTDCAWTIEPRE